MTTVNAGYRLDADQAWEALQAARRHDSSMLQDETQATAVSWLYALGLAIVAGAIKLGDKLPDLEIRLIYDAARHAGNKVLGQSGDDLRRQLTDWERKDDCARRFETEAQAMDWFEELVAHWYISTALEAYLAACDEDEDWRERLENEIDNFEEISSTYRVSLLTSASGLSALTWLAVRTPFVKNFRALLPENVNVPYYLEAQWYADHGPAV